MPITLRLIDDYKSGFSEINADMTRVKKSLIPFGLVNMIAVVMACPHFIRDYLLADFGDKMTFIFSNVPGCKKPYTLNGLDSKK